MAARLGWLEPLLILAGAAGWAWLLARLQRRSLQMLQLEGYLTPRFLLWWLRRPTRMLSAPRSVGVLAGLALGAATLALPPGLRWLAVAGWGALGWLLAAGATYPAARKPLVMTARAWRLVAGLVFELALGLGGWLLVAPQARLRTALLMTGLAGAALKTPLLTALANLLLFPVEEAFRRYYLRDAAARLRRLGPTVVAVAGSYGKTSTKELLAAILSERFEVLRPPGSHNTPMGLSRVIREQLEPRHEVLVAELGDWVPGDIAELCLLLQPTVGVLTTIGPEHLERFKTMERVLASKRELLEALPAGGTAVINADDPYVQRLLHPTPAARLLRYGLSDPAATVRARDVRTGRSGLRLVVEVDGQGEVVLTVPLLGRHNASNLLAAVGAALALGMTLPEIARGARRIRPVEHRLQPIEGAGGVLVIDDAFNANPSGAAAALEVLSELEARQRILVTPGIVELGAQEREANRALGRQAAAVCDQVILVGQERAEPIAAGLREAGFAGERIHVVGDLSGARDRLAGLVGRGDVVLFENDLPDTYADTP
jgi:UDP-N-acetylmuramoyl-tripeptide--D-alanyl-D-alanine ligase